MQKQTWTYQFGILILLCSLFVVVSVLAASDTHEGWLPRGEIALNQAVTDLTNDMTIMCLAAHPDDEDGATLTYYRKKFGAGTAILVATRGEGGQNQIGPELYEELGVIRARETQAASEIYGSEVYNLNKRDFGFSKTAEETFRFWGHEDSLRRLVRIIRKVRPDVIITNHGTERGHGNHQAVGIIALEAFDAAADPDKFPEQIQNGLSQWQVKRLFLRSGKEEADVTVNIGEYDQPRGYSYAQIAGEGLKMHKSQGMGGNAQRGPAYRYYKLIRFSAPAPEKMNSLLDGLTSDAEPSIILPDRFIKDAVEAISISHSRVTEDLLKYINYIRALRDLKTTVKEEELREKEKELESAAAKAMDLYLTVEPGDAIVTRSQEFAVRVSLTNCGHAIIEDIELGLFAPQLGDVMRSENPVFERLGYNETVRETFGVKVSDDADYTLPHADHLYDDSFMKPLIQGVARYKVARESSPPVSLSITSEATVDVAADVELRILPENSMIPLSSEDQTVRYVVNVINRMSGRIPEGRIEFFPPSDWSVEGINQDFDLEENQQGFAAFNVTIPSGATPGDFSLKAKASYKTSDDVSGLMETTGILNIVDVKVADDLYVGYVRSYDNTLERSLKQLNVKSRSLESDDLRFGDLSIYDTIILDIRAYLVRDDLIASNQRLLDYVNNGGNLIVMYNKTYEWNGRQYAPYKLILSHNRVTVEEAPITILTPEHPLFTFPNRIADTDWDNWIQERGLYFPSEYAPEYKELLSCNDPDENPLRGGYLMAEYGKGTYIYTSYVWYRQLQKLNPGAFRNFANMISLPKR